MMKELHTDGTKERKSSGTREWVSEWVVILMMMSSWNCCYLPVCQLGCCLSVCPFFWSVVRRCFWIMRMTIILNCSSLVDSTHQRSSVFVIFYLCVSQYYCLMLRRRSAAVVCPSCLPANQLASQLCSSSFWVGCCLYSYGLCIKYLLSSQEVSLNSLGAFIETPTIQNTDTGKTTQFCCLKNKVNTWLGNSSVREKLLFCCCSYILYFVVSFFYLAFFFPRYYNTLLVNKISVIITKKEQ